MGNLAGPAGGTIEDIMVKLQGGRAAAFGALLVGLLAAGCAPGGPPGTQPGASPTPTPGCRPDLGETGAQVAVQLLQPGPQGGLVPVGGPSARAQARSGQTVRLLIRPVEGPARPSGPECPVRVRLDGLVWIGRLQARGGFVIDGEVAYALLRPGEERAIDFELKPFDDWDPAYDRLEIEKATVTLPQAAEFFARLPAPFRPPPGTVCADVFYPDGQPAAGLMLNLAAPPDSPTQRKPAGPDGRVCWDGFDESTMGELSLDPKADPALGQPRTRYVSREASYRLFIARRPR
jgi:hypothetical protein